MEEEGLDLEKIIKDCLASDEVLTVKEFTDIVQLSFNILYNKGDMLKEVEKNLGEDVFNSLMSSFIGTILINVKLNSKNVEEEKVPDA